MDQDNSQFNGKWSVPKIPDNFNKILKLIGYSTLERQYFKKSSVYIYSTLKDNVLTLNQKKTGPAIQGPAKKV